MRKKRSVVHRTLGELFQTILRQRCPCWLSSGPREDWAVWEKRIWDSLLASARCVFLASPRAGTRDGENKQTGLFRGMWEE